MCCVVGLNDVVCFSTLVRIAFRCVCVVRASCKEVDSMLFFCASVCCGSTLVRIAFGCVCVVRASCKEVYSMLFLCASVCCGGCMSIVCLYTNYRGVGRLWLIGKLCTAVNCVSVVPFWCKCGVFVIHLFLGSMCIAFRCDVWL